ncbi:nucleoporin GLE1 [Anoplophora glabripennis]|uniref:nucleoporin GLE1 n=1 Tax=Anoplophora glabripennis TaxID=217634 RepID=UPI0008739969|nr:nucleoporin GLE1 [Anoplophora glabripennis]
MGLSVSKSPLERRNTVARRSQRRTIHTIKARVDKLFPSIKRFRGVNNDEDYQALHTEIDHLRIELIKKSRDLQPQIRAIYDSTLKRIDEAFVALEDKLKENQEKAIKKEREREEKAEKKKEKQKNKEGEEVTSENNDVIVEEVEEEAANEADNLAGSTEKRHTVELKFVHVVPGEITQADIHSNNNNVVKSPEEKRKSILKHGVAVMPGAMMNELAARSSNTVSIQEPQVQIERDSEKINARINEIIETLQSTEYQIADFVGKKHGTQYNRIKDKLSQNMTTLNSFSPSDDYTIEQVKICKNYIVSCLNFLEEKAIEEEKVPDDDVFFPSNTNSVVSPVTSPTLSPVLSPSLSPVDARNQFERLSKTTAI